MLVPEIGVVCLLSLAENSSQMLVRLDEEKILNRTGCLRVPCALTAFRKGT